MKLKLTSYVFLLLLLIVTVKVQAEDTPTTATSPATTRSTNAVNRQTLKDRITEMRKLAQTNFASKREEFKTRLALIKDERKKTLAQRIDTKLANVNKLRTDEMSQTIERLNSVLEKLNIKIGAAKNSNEDTASAEAAYTLAKTAVSSAEAAVSTQASREYVATIADESTLKTTFGAVVSQLETDLKATHALVVDAKQAVLKAAEAVYQLRTASSP